MRKLLRPALLVVLVAAVGIAIELVAPAVTQAKAYGPRLLLAESNRLVFEVTIPAPTVEQVTVEGRAFQRLFLPGYRPVGQPGQPEVLQRGVLVGIPPTGKVVLRVLEAQTEVLPGRYTLIPVPVRQLSFRPESGQPDLKAGLQQRFAFDSAAYALDAFQPPEVVTVDDVAFIRQQRVARLVLYPIQYNPARGTVRVIRRLRVEVSFSGAKQAEALADKGPPQENAFEPLLRALLLNYEQAKAWRASRRPAATPADTGPRPGDGSRPWLKIIVPASGLYRITLADLQATGRPELTAADPALLQIWYNGHQIAADFLGDDDTTFEEDEALVFYAQVPFSPYSRRAIYWLAVGDQPGLRMATDDGSPPDQPAMSSFPATLHLEEDLVFRGELPLGDNHGYPRWYGRELSNLFQPTQTYQVVLPQVVTSGYTATLQLRLMGVTSLPTASPDHKVNVELNGHLLGSVIWEGQTPISQTFPFSATLLTDGENQIRLSLPGDLPGVALERAFVDWIELHYRRSATQVGDLLTFEADGSGERRFELAGFQSAEVLAYDITDPGAPRRVAGLQVESPAGPAAASGQLRIPSSPLITEAQRLFLPLVPMDAPAGAYRVIFGTQATGPRRFVVSSLARVHPVRPLLLDTPSNLHDPDRQADYLLITPSEFITAAQTLAAHRQSAGLSVAVINIQDIFDEFAGGQPTPQAIHDFIDYAYHNWQAPAPAYVLLLGDGYYDYRLLTGKTTYPNFVPPYMGCFDPWLCEVASDNAYVTVSGDDRLPDLLIGRLPAHDLSGANRMVAKILNYEDSPAEGNWRHTITFVADNAFTAQGQPDPAGNFENLVEGVISLVPAGFQPERIYYDPYAANDAGENFRYRTPAATTQAILNAVNTGRLFVNYTGHAGNNVWAHEWLLVGKARQRNDVNQMNNGALLPIFLDMACLSGNFADVTYEALQETLIARKGGGSVAGWAASGFGVATGHDQLHAGFYRAIFEQGVREVGLAALSGKLNLWNVWGRYFVDLLDTFGLIGDPALRIALPGDNG